MFFRMPSNPASPKGVQIRSRPWNRSRDGHRQDARVGKAKRRNHSSQALGLHGLFCAMKQTAIVEIDLGSILEELTCRGITCADVRHNSQLPLPTDNLTNIIAGTTKQSIGDAIGSQMQRKVADSVPKNWMSTPGRASSTFSSKPMRWGLAGRVNS
jgi:UDP-N-acetylglucosamine 2-epimerase